MLKIGITGGIGSGKTTVCRIFETLGIPVYYADLAARRLMESDPDLVGEVKALFGPDIYTADERLDRPRLAAIVFNAPERLQALNGLVHPAVARDLLRWQSRQSGVPYTLKEAALIFEAGSYRFLDKVIVVAAPEALRITRVMERDGVGEEEVRARIARQWPEAEKIKRADYVIHNDGHRLIIPQIMAIHRELVQLNRQQKHTND